MRSAYFPPGRNRRRKLAMLPTSEKQQPIHSASQGPSSCHRWKLSATSAAPLVCPSRRAVATIPLAQEQQCTAGGREREIDQRRRRRIALRRAADGENQECEKACAKQRRHDIEFMRRPRRRRQILQRQ